jgi:hypothetical protein
MSRRERMPVEPLSYDQRSYPQVRGGLSEDNLKRHILAVSQGVDILKMTPSAPPPDSPLSNDPQFQTFGGETTSIQLRPRLRGYLSTTFPLDGIPYL